MTSLQQKLEMNSERRGRENILPSLPSALQIVLTEAKTRYSKHLFHALGKSPFPTFKEGILTTKDDFDLYWHVEFDQIQHIDRVLSESKFRFQSPIALHLGKGPVYLVDDNLGNF